MARNYVVCQRKTTILLVDRCYYRSLLLVESANFTFDMISGPQRDVEGPQRDVELIVKFISEAAFHDVWQS